LQGEAPKPTSNDVNIVNIPKRKAYVAQFGGFATEQSLLKEAATLAEAAKVIRPSSYMLALFCSR